MEMKSGGKGLSKKYILEEVEQSLKRLKTDRIDLYQSHKDDESVPLEETLEAYAQLIDEGKVRYIGASNYKGGRLAAAEDLAEREKLPAYKTLQPEYNLHDRKGYEEDLAPVAEKYGLGVIPYFSLAWLLEQPTITAPIASATNTQQMEALFAAVDLKLSAAQLALLTDASAY
jgi:aryl-alcohol dehydrogenase-like predicted oxidoreductase